MRTGFTVFFIFHILLKLQTGVILSVAVGNSNKNWPKSLFCANTSKRRVAGGREVWHSVQELICSLGFRLAILFFEALWRIYLDYLQVEQVEPLWREGEWASTDKLVSSQVVLAERSCRFTSCSVPSWNLRKQLDWLAKDPCLWMWFLNKLSLCYTVFNLPLEN